MRKSSLERLAFLDAVHESARAGAPDDCVLWPFGADRYGWLNYEGRQRRAHVVSLIRWSGEDRTPEGLEVAHYSCGVCRCVNPRHLRWSTHAENVSDTIRVGRHRGRLAKLTPAQVEEMRRRSAAGARNVDLAHEFGVSTTCVSRTVRGERWPEVSRS